MMRTARDGGKPECDGIVWPEWPVYGDEERRAAAEVVDSGKWWYGDRVARFETEFAAFQDAAFAVSCTNGTAALRMGLAACGVGPGDEVIVPPYTFVATALAPMLLGATPVFADIDIETANLSPESASRVVTERTKAIVPVHFAGLPCDMEAFGKLAADHGISVVEDACHSWGSKWNGKGTGAIGRCGAFSFQMSKNITAGEGGILLSDDPKIAEFARSYSNCGRRDGAPWYEHYILADNLRMTEVQAALLSVQLGRLAEQTAKREANAGILDRVLADLDGVSIPPRPSAVDRRAYHIYLFRFTGEGWTIDRDEFVAALDAEGVPCSSGYPIPLTRQPLFADRRFDAGGVEATERLCREAVWLPHTLLLASAEAVERAGAAIVKLARAYR